MKRTHYCAEVGKPQEGKSVVLCGWIDAMRDHGGVVFVDLRDRSGIVQVVIDPEEFEPQKAAPELRMESVLQVEGVARMRPEGTENPNLETGEMEVSTTSLTVLSQAQPLPFLPGAPGVGEETRLRYRHLDLRTSDSQRRMRIRSDFVAAVRGFLHEEGFIDIETPMLTRSTPEGARDFLVPSRQQKKAFYALPQSPQLFKQSLMGAGFDRYYQIVKCFRDEDFRSDRQAEFTQIDIEMSFVEPEDVIALTERMVVNAFRAGGIELEAPFPRITHDDAVRDYATDRPDLRNPLKVTEITELVRDVEFKVFSGPAKDPDGRVVALRVPSGASLSRQAISELTDLVASLGAKGLAYIKVEQADPPKLQSPIVKFLDESLLSKLLELARCADGDMLFFGSGRADIVNKTISALRGRLCDDFNLGQREWAPVWVTDFPLFGYDYNTKSWHANHHPFTAPVDGDLGRLGPSENCGQLRSKAYDLVLNGTEIGGGSIRIHDREIQLKVLEMLGIGKEQAEEKFGFLLDVMSHGMPPHGGIAMGVDRMVQILTRTGSIRDVIAFPKTQRGQCMFTGAPAGIDAGQLAELGLLLKKGD